VAGTLAPSKWCFPLKAMHARHLMAVGAPWRFPFAGDRYRVAELATRV